MAIWIRTTDGRTEKVKTEGDDSSAIEAIIKGSGPPVQNGWIELEGRQRQFVNLAQVVSVESRSRETSIRKNLAGG